MFFPVFRLRIFDTKISRNNFFVSFFSPVFELRIFHRCFSTTSDFFQHCPFFHQFPDLEFFTLIFQLSTMIFFTATSFFHSFSNLKFSIPIFSLQSCYNLLNDLLDDVFGKEKLNIPNYCKNNYQLGINQLHYGKT